MEQSNNPVEDFTSKIVSEWLILFYLMMKWERQISSAMISRRGCNLQICWSYIHEHTGGLPEHICHKKGVSILNIEY